VAADTGHVMPDRDTDSDERDTSGRWGELALMARAVDVH